MTILNIVYNVFYSNAPLEVRCRYDGLCVLCVIREYSFSFKECILRTFMHTHIYLLITSLSLWLRSSNNDLRIQRVHCTLLADH